MTDAQDRDVAPVPLDPGFRLLGPSTRPTRLTTGEIIQFEREALQRSVEEGNKRFIPQPVEHLHYLPPVGRVTELRLVEHQGHAYVAMREERLAAGTVADLLLEHNLADSQPVADLQVSLATEPRNFDESDMADIKRSSPVELGEIALHSDLPPIVWSFTVFLGGAGIWGAKVFLGEFLKGLGHESSQSLTSWLRSVAERARKSNREQMAEFRFEPANGIQVLAFCPFDPALDGSIADLRSSFENLSDVGAFVSSSEGRVSEEIREIAFLWDRDTWRLAWCASDSGSFVTPWFQKNAPPPERFLGYLPPTLRLLTPYMPELPGAEPVEQEASPQPIASVGMSNISSTEVDEVE